ncbi:LOB domain-containing protein 18-like [Senna tora]|uniref:LOB domain-containing protein 18-like n=1 Tax=Senna tora TaxID=362788 RepID=A0A834XFY7_9FABA|nr:LOB domain-containing protein 18-like [Senna tora]
MPGCIFAPYFDSDQGATLFAAVHRVFGASNVSKLLQNIPVHKRLDAAVTICYEAQARLRDPVYGCVMTLQAELSYLQGHLATLESPLSQSTTLPCAISLTDDVPSGVSDASSTYDLSSLFDPMPQNTWATQQRPMGANQYVGGGPSHINSGAGGGNGDLQTLAREFLDRHRSPPIAASSTQSLSK